MDLVEATLAQMSALDAIQAANAATGPRQRAIQLTEEALRYVEGNSDLSMGEAILAVAYAQVLGTDPTVTIPSPSTEEGEDFPYYMWEHIAFAWCSFVAKGVSPKGLCETLRAHEPRPDGSWDPMEVEALLHWAGAIEAIEEDFEQAGRLFQMAIDMAYSIESPLLADMQWTYAATLFQ